jgi:hypothetical protein
MFWTSQMNFTAVNAVIFTCVSVNMAYFFTSHNHLYTHSGQNSNPSACSGQHIIFVCSGQDSTFSQRSTRHFFRNGPRSNLYGGIGRHSIFFAVVHATISTYVSANTTIFRGQRSPFSQRSTPQILAAINTTLFSSHSAD